MNEKYGLIASNFLRTLPTVLQNDQKMQALAAAIAAELEKLAGESRLAQIYTRIDELDETMLDVLAADFKVDWWRPDASLEEKRYALKVNWYVHKHLGTKSAIETAVANYLGEGKVEEWFDYDGKPHHFRIKDGNNNAILENFRLFISVLNIVQRGSSVLDSVSALLRHQNPLFIGMSMKVAKSGIISCETVDMTVFSTLTDQNNVPLIDDHGNLLIM